MGTLLILSSCCFAIAACQPYSDLERNLLSFRDQPKQGHVEVFKDDHVKQLFASLLGRTIRVGPQTEIINLDTRNEAPIIEPVTSATAPLPEVMLLHRQLQNKLGWGSDDGRNSNSNQYVHPPPRSNVQNNYGPPPPPVNNVRNHNGPSPSDNNVQNYGPPQNNVQNYGPPQNNVQNYGPPQNNVQNYGPPQNNVQNYGPPQKNVQNYGPPQEGPPPPSGNNVREQYSAKPGGDAVKSQYGPPGGFPPTNNEVNVNNNLQPTDGYGGPPPPLPNQDYGAPAEGGNQGGQPLRINQGNFGGYVENIKSSNDVGKIFKHVFIHTPPTEPEYPQQARVLRPNHNKQDTHYQIIFVKAPAPKQEPPTTIELPAEPIRKTLVYVLVKKPEKSPPIKFIPPRSTPISKPEVYFIRYKGDFKGNEQVPNTPLEVDPKDNDIGNLDSGYSSPLSSQPDIGGIRPLDFPKGSKSHDTVGYPNTEYRASPNMLSPNQEPMSIAVYDRVRNGVESKPNNGLVTSSSNLSRQKGSHYTSPGSQPFEKPSGRMVNGQYVGMTSNSLRNQYYSTPVDDDRREYQ